MSDASNTPTSAGVCHGCGEHARKLYGGMGRYFVYCLRCWSTDKPERDLEAESK